VILVWLVPSIKNTKVTSLCMQQRYINPVCYEPSIPKEL